MCLAFNGIQILTLILCKNLLWLKGNKGIEIIYKTFKIFSLIVQFSRIKSRYLGRKICINSTIPGSKDMQNLLIMKCCNLFGMLLMTVGIQPNYVHKATQLRKAAAIAAAICYHHCVITYWRQHQCSILKLIILSWMVLKNFRVTLQMIPPSPGR